MKKYILVILGLILVGGASAFFYSKTAFGDITALTSSDTQNTERTTVNNLINLANNLSTTTANTWTALQTFSSTGTTTWAGGIQIDGGGFQVSTLTTANCDLKADTSGNFYCGADSAGTAVWPFTTGLTHYGQAVQATTTPLWLQATPYSLLASSTAVFVNASSTLLTATTGYFPTASTTNLTVGAVKSALLLTNGNGVVSGYGGAAACTNQFVTALSALGASTCASINNDQWSGTDLSVANGGTGASTLTGLLQGNGTSAFTVVTDSSTAGQILRVTGSATYAWGALNLADTDAVTGSLPATNGGTGATSLGTAFTVSSNVFTFIDEPAFSYATSTTWTGTTTRVIRLPIIAETVTGLRCKAVPSGATVNVHIGKWTASTTMIVASSTSNIYSFASTLSVAATELLAYAMGTPTGSPTEINCTVRITK